MQSQHHSNTCPIECLKICLACLWFIYPFHHLFFSQSISVGSQTGWKNNLSNCGNIAQSNNNSICCRNELASFLLDGEKKKTCLWMGRWGWKDSMRMTWCGGEGAAEGRGMGGAAVRTATKSPSVGWYEGAVYLRVRSEIKVGKHSKLGGSTDKVTLKFTAMRMQHRVAVWC